jgi:hypothetical protein
MHEAAIVLRKRNPHFTTLAIACISQVQEQEENLLR